MDKYIKFFTMLSTLFILIVGLTSTVSATNYEWTPEQFLGNITNIETGDNITISSGEANFSNDYEISKDNVTVKAIGDVTLKGKGDYYFKITGKNVTLQGISFLNSEEQLIYWEGEYGILENCNFINLSSKLDYGVVNMEGEFSKVINCTFSDNTGYQRCGALYVDGDYVYVENCTFINNIAYEGGCAIYSEYNKKITINNCKFINNTDLSTSESNGGGAITLRGCRNTTVMNCTFTNCYSHKGSAIFLSTSDDDCCDNFKSISNKFIDCGSSGYFNANIFNIGGKNLSVIGGEGAIIYNCNTEKSDATISNLVTVYILDNETKDVENNEKTTLYAQLTVGGENNIIVGYEFKFIIGNHIISAEFNNTHYIYDYPINGTLGEEITVGGECNVNASKIEYRNGTLHIKAIVPLNITSKDITYGENLTVTLKINQNATGNITLFINGKEFGTKDISKGTAKFTVPNLNVDKYAIEAVYNGDDKYSNVKNTTNINVRKANPILKIAADDINYGENASVSIATSYNMTKYLILTLNDESYNISASTTRFTIPKHLNSGDYTVWISYFGDDNYNSNLNFTKFTVKPIATYTNVSVDSIDGNAIIYINTTDIKGKTAEGYVIVLVNGSHTYSTLVRDGTGEVIIGDLPTGKYHAVVTFNSSGNYGVSYDSCSFEITSAPSGFDLIGYNVYKEFENDTQYHVKVTDSLGNPLANMTVLVSISNSNWVKNANYTIVTDKDGIATLTINLLPGDYKITAHFADKITINNITVIATNFNLKADNLVKYFKNSTQYTVKVTDKNNNPVVNRTVTISINKASWKNPVKYYVKTNNDGIATLEINLISGTYSVTANICYNSTKSTITVLPTLTTSNLVKKVNKEANLKAKLVDGQGKPDKNKEIQFTVKDKVYTFTTDSNGIATLPIHLGIGTWSILIANPDTCAQTRATVKVTK